MGKILMKREQAAASDARLLEQWSQGSVGAFDTLFLRYYARVYGLAFRLLGSPQAADDVAQEVFLKLYQQPLPAGGEPDLPTSRHNLPAWLYRVTVNRAYNLLRAEMRRERREVTTQGDAPPDPAEHALRQEERWLVRQALAALPPRQAQLLILRHTGFSYRELAEILQVAPTSVGTLLARAERDFEEAYLKLVGKGQNDASLLG